MKNRTENNVLVTVICMTYNHERYIRQCLESLVSQITDFSYEIIVHDDASTDNTANIVREFEKKYPHLIRPVYQTVNQFHRVQEVYADLLSMAKGKYIADCEGDDFWTSVYKLQKQADYMESNEKCSVCAHAAYYAAEDGTLQEGTYFRPYDESKVVPIEDILNNWRFATNSLFYHKAAKDEGIIPYQQDCQNGDYATIVYLALKGEVYYIDELMSAYRVVSIGSLNWVAQEDLDKFYVARSRYIEMIKRIDEYTKGKYHTILKSYRDNVSFEMHLTMGHIREVRKYEEKFRKLTYKQKIKLYIQGYFPKCYNVLRNIKRRFRRI